MDKNLFVELKQSLIEAKAIRHGKLQPSRQFEVESIDVKAVRERTKLSQEEFATAIHVSVRTLQNWEQHRRTPTGPAAALLKIVNTAPEVAIKALHAPFDTI
ncbi:helix-turn-helix domain-containing protein [Paenalcaligenes niemegkensis]|uniref:NadS family protein n=1 Tax=Paenalcaligenes niemegkensis TaxID=2895469 RepID=UPI001EE97288|nr:NadS family protein [Paenalcaligenes niemegkensis]MCQ9616396.1 helix-turn-helix domain-containing protein [Paenalcaligenes niemegkensis]